MTKVNSLNKHRLSTYYVPSFVLHTGRESGVSETSKLPSLTEPKFCWEDRQRKMNKELSKIMTEREVTA